MIITDLILAAATAADPGVDLNNVVSLISALAAAAAIGITSLRKRKDVSIEELEKRNRRLVEENTQLTTERDDAREVANKNGRDLFTVRQVLASKGLPDPTLSERSETP